jgi:hypothetical protein
METLEIVATDGPIGSLLGRRVLLSPMAVSSTEWDEQKILLSISRDPSRGVSRQAIATALMNGPGV